MRRMRSGSEVCLKGVRKKYLIISMTCCIGMKTKCERPAGVQAWARRAVEMRKIKPPVVFVGGRRIKGRHETCER